MSYVTEVFIDCVKTALANSIRRACNKVGGEYGYEEETGTYWWSTTNMTNVYVSTTDFRTFRIETAWIENGEEFSTVTDMTDILAVRDALMEEEYA